MKDSTRWGSEMTFWERPCRNRNFTIRVTQPTLEVDGPTSANVLMVKVNRKWQMVISAAGE